MPGRGQDSLGVKSAALRALGLSLDSATHQLDNPGEVPEALGACVVMFSS